MTRLFVPALLAAVALFWVAAASANPKVTSKGSTVTVEARTSTLRAVVDALATETGRRFAVDGDADPSVDGAFEGTVEEVIGEMLRNLSFLISQRDEGYGPVLHITLLGEPGGPAPPVVGNLNLPPEAMQPSIMPPEQFPVSQFPPGQLPPPGIQMPGVPGLLPPPGT